MRMLNYTLDCLFFKNEPKEVRTNMIIITVFTIIKTDFFFYEFSYVTMTYVVYWQCNSSQPKWKFGKGSGLQEWRYKESCLYMQ